MKADEIVKRYEYLKQERKGSVDQLWDLIERFVIPLRGDFYTTLNSENEVDWHRRDIYDSTAIFAAQSLAASLHGNLTSSAQKWFDLKFRNDELNEDAEAKRWLEASTEAIYNALGESDFDIEIAECYLDLVTFGTSVLTEEIDEQTGKLNFSAVPVREAFFEEDHNKQVYRFYRHLQWTAPQLISRFGEDGVPQCIRDMMDSPQGAVERKSVVFCVYRRDLDEEVDEQLPMAPNKRPFGYKYVLMDTKDELGEEGGYYEMPAFVARWRKTTGSRWGHSPAAVALGDILTLNQVKEATLEAAAKAIDPANIAEESALLGDLNLDRGSLTVVSNINGIRPYESGARFDVSNLNIDMLTDSIRKHFYQDQLELRESPAMTATEVNVRYELMQRLLGPTFGRLKTDLLDPLIKRAFNIMYRENLLPELPEQLSGAMLDIEYSGPLPRSQRFDTAMAIQEFLMSVGQTAQLFPEALDIVDIDGAMRALALMRGVPARALRDQRQIEEMRMEREQQQQAMMAAQQGMAAGEAMQAVGEGAQAMQGADPAMLAAMAEAGGQM